MEDEDDITSLYAAVKEGIDNAVVHGNRRNEELRVEVNFLVDNTKVTVLVEDQGKGFDWEYYLDRLDREDAFEEAKKRIVEEGMRGGLGILLMSRCVDRIHYAGFGNILRLEKNISARR
jgi:serine/threonine-protein kinase RsbW